MTDTIFLFDKNPEKLCNKRRFEHCITTNDYLSRVLQGRDSVQIKSF